MNKSTNKGKADAAAQGPEGLHSALQSEEDEMTRKQEECFRMMLGCVRDEGKLQVGGLKATIRNMKLIIRRLARGNSFFRAIDLQLPRSTSKLYKQMYYITYQATRGEKPAPTPQTSPKNLKKLDLGSPDRKVRLRRVNPRANSAQKTTAQTAKQ